MVPVGAPVRVASLLARLPDQRAEVVHRSRSATYVVARLSADAARVLLGVTGPDAVGLPCALRALRLPPPGSAEMVAGVLHLGGEPLAVRRLLDCRVPPVNRAPVTSGPVTSGPVTSGPVATGLVPPDLAARLGRPGAAAALVGRGPGLTPLGDDLLAGWLVAHRAAGVPTPDLDVEVPGLLSRTTELSAALLACALAGEAADPVRDHLAALGTGREPASLAALLHVGHTSGAGLAAGLHAALGRLAADGHLAGCPGRAA